MTTTMNRKYTDRDVREDERLILLAHKYLLEYTGEWSVVLDFKWLLESGGGLNIAQIRTVLNIMLADVKVYNMPQPTPRVFDARQELARAVLTIPHRRIERPRPHTLELKAAWKRPFLVSISPRACRIHSLDKYKSKITYHPLAPVERKWRVDVRPICGSSLAIRNMRMLSEEEANGLIGTINQYMEYFAWCTTCVSVEGFREEASDE